MVYAPGHYQEVTRPRERRRRERVWVRVVAMVTLVVLGLVVYSLTTHQRKTGNGCIDFNYTTMIGGAEMYKCGTAAKRLCVTRPSKASIDADFQTELYAACRKARLKVGTG